MGQPMKLFKILITGAGTTTAMTALKGLRAVKDSSLHITMGDMQRNCAGAYLGDDFVQMPPASAVDFVERATSICRKRQIDLVIPIIDYEFVGWARAAEPLADSGTKVVISPAKALEVCQEKDQTDGYFRSLGVPCPDTWRPVEIRDEQALPFPVIIKPRCGRASLDTYKAENLREYRFYLTRVPDPIVQPCLRGEEVTIDTISDLQGRFLAASPRIRVEVKGGQAFKSVTIEAPELVEFARRIVEPLPIIGPSNIQCFLTDEGVRFFEINARFGAGTILSIAAGMNGPAGLVAMARGENLPPLVARPGLTMMRYWQEVYEPPVRCWEAKSWY
jgi:carbamoyl-phosphate synthase large subunit